MGLRRGFTLLEMVITVMVISILAGVAVPRFLEGIERTKAAEVRQVFLTARGGYLRRISDGESVSPSVLSWGALGMTDPNGNANRFFDYSFVPGQSQVRAIRSDDSAKWLRIQLDTGAITKSSTAMY